MSDTTTPASDSAEPTVHSSVIEYTLSQLGRNRPGVLTYDGQTFVVVDQDGNQVFTAHKSQVTKISRLEFLLTIKSADATVFLTFGNRKQLAMAGLAGGGSSGGVAGLAAMAGSHMAFERSHNVSGLTGWTQLLESEGLMGSHLSTSTPIKMYVTYPLIGLGIIAVVVAVVVLVS